MQVTGYHTLQDRKNPEEVEQKGPQPCYRRDAWLGYGYYFWDTEINWAHDWGKQDPQKRVTGYMIFEAILSINDNTFDLFGNVAHQKDFAECAEIMSIKSDNINVPQIIEYLKRHSDFKEKYNSIRAFDDPKPVRYKYNIRGWEQISLNKRVQICLIDKTNLILDSFKVIFPEKYLK